MLFMSGLRIVGGGVKVGIILLKIFQGLDSSKGFVQSYGQFLGANYEIGFNNTNSGTGMGFVKD